MYIPKHFEQPSIDAMHALMEQYPFATLVTMEDEELCANHIPVELHPEPEPYGTLAGHVSRANPLWKTSDGKDVLVIFQGPNAYITPSWYPTKQDTGKVVPTWNYVIVHAHGRIRAVDNSEWLRAHVGSLTNDHEASFADRWAVSDAPGEFVERMLGGIVGIEVTITKLVGKWKVSQNRPERDRTGVVEGLSGIGASEMAEVVENGKK